jgi:hypothetical protein
MSRGTTWARRVDVAFAPKLFGLIDEYLQAYTSAFAACGRLPVANGSSTTGV